MPLIALPIAYVPRPISESAAAAINTIQNNYNFKNHFLIDLVFGVLCCASV
jgi:hypothetical protein